MLHALLSLRPMVAKKMHKLCCVTLLHCQIPAMNASCITSRVVHLFVKSFINANCPCTVDPGPWVFLLQEYIFSEFSLLFWLCLFSYHYKLLHWFYYLISLVLSKFRILRRELGMTILFYPCGWFITSVRLSICSNLDITMFFSSRHCAFL